ncbi:MAG: aldolase/citrate lyase family protein [Bacteroidia bacterium]|nr:aldolase/citrate lyase family protein [Bacteroidia bacterium]
MTAIAGISGQGVRSDCLVTLELTESGGNEINLVSKVITMYGESIRKLVSDELQFFGIKNAIISVEDSGALEFVLMARVEAAIKQLINPPLEYLPEMLAGNHEISAKERFRFSRLYLPGNTPGLMINAGIHHPDGIILDLEDSVAPAKKAEARFVVRNALRAVDFYKAERMVRINQIPGGLEDLSYIIPHNVHLILVPKCESPEQIELLENEITRIKNENNIEQDIFLMPIIESALGVENAFLIAKSSANIVAMAIGLEDYTADLGVKRTKEANESLYARTRLVNACKAAAIQPINSVFSDVADMDGLYENVKVSRSLGFEGMGCIHPRQIRVIQNAFAPTSDEIDKAGKIVNAYMEASEKGLGVVSLGTKMIDPPVVKRAEKTIQLAIRLGLISQDWRY